ncbi:hypothetical protein SpCBS45565_g08199 [Spizellomyces sp. 'palustris']|nr:hypothetical protein SpCBS45565_g08199 [Spizellomyces sp. 'palustris']
MPLHRTEVLVPCRAFLLPVHQGSVRAGTCNVKTKRLLWERLPSVQDVAPSAKCFVKHDKDHVFNSIVTSLMGRLVGFPEEASVNKETVKLEILVRLLMRTTETTDIMLTTELHLGAVQRAVDWISAHPQIAIPLLVFGGLLILFILFSILRCLCCPNRKIKPPITRSSGRSRQPPPVQQQMPAGGITWVDPTPYNGPQLPTVPPPAQTRQASY